LGSEDLKSFGAPLPLEQKHTVWIRTGNLELQLPGEIELQLPGERELLPENSVKAWYRYNWSVYGEKAFTSNTQRALQTSAGSSRCCSESKLSMCRKFCSGFVCAVPEIKFILFYFLSQGVDRGKSMYFKASDLCLVNTT
jgi:hypothetical protein